MKCGFDQFFKINKSLKSVAFVYIPAAFTSIPLEVIGLLCKIS